jgi:leucyl aminopeptidase
MHLLQPHSCIISPKTHPGVHLDVAGKELIDEDRPLHRAGGTGFGVQVLK